MMIEAEDMTGIKSIRNDVRKEKRRSLCQCVELESFVL
jgi:hypothetical protein